ncbi:zinc ribbon domain-containing protein YjdM [Marinobacterium litorale]|uniref:zinc ribbon domain-containing protein YjdM n=1 Tax=Marinobacterium litorale TaxID=404770 RepID=UPI00042A4899|nr:zinc ribbon domain-containing protein YjdM [Marinobacterium litorale]
MADMPACPQCAADYTYEDQGLYVCPSCGHEWAANEPVEQEDSFVVRDANGNQLADGDNVTLIKDLKVKGSSSTIKVGTKVRINRLVDGDHNIDCKVDGIGPMMLKSEFVKKA